MTIAAPEVFDAPKGDENSLDASANTLRNKVGAIGTTLSTYTERTASAMDAMASVRAQQLFSYVGKATSMLQNAQESAGSAGTAIADYASELSEVKQELESLRNQWVDLAEDDKALSESYRVWAQRACVAEPEIEGTDGVTWDQLGAPPVVLSATGRDLGLPFTGKEYPVVGQLISMAQVDLELIKARTGMTLADLGYDTPEEQLAWLTGEGAQMRERELPVPGAAPGATPGPPDIAQAYSHGRFVWRYFIKDYTNPDPRAWRFARWAVDSARLNGQHFNNWWNGRISAPEVVPNGHRTSLLDAYPHNRDKHPLNPMRYLHEWSPKKGTWGAYDDWYGFWVTGDRSVDEKTFPDGSTGYGHAERLQAGAGTTTAFKPPKPESEDGKRPFWRSLGPYRRPVGLSWGRCVRSPRRRPYLGERITVR